MMQKFLSKIILNQKLNQISIINQGSANISNFNLSDQLKNKLQNYPSPSTTNILPLGVSLNNKIIQKLSNFRDDIQAPSGFFQTKTQMSSHNFIGQEKIVRVLKQFEMSFKVRAGGQQIVLEYCPFCEKPHYNEVTNKYTLNIQTQSGLFNCFRCSIKGNWWDFKNLMWRNITLRDYKTQMLEIQGQDGRGPGASAGSKLEEAEYFIYHKNLVDQKDFQSEIDYLTNKTNPASRQLSYETLTQYQIGLGYQKFPTESGNLQEIKVVYFPMYRLTKAAFQQIKQLLQKAPPKKDKIPAPETANISAPIKSTKKVDPELDENKSIQINTQFFEVIKCKVRGVGAENQKYQRIKPSGGFMSGLFGLNTVPFDAKQIVITEGEYDAMAVHQATGYPAISLPNGATSLPNQVLQYLEHFEKIYLWMDEDQAGRLNAPQLAEKLGLQRTYVVRTALVGNGDDYPKDANDALRKDQSKIIQFLKKAKTIPDQNIIQFNDISQIVYNRINRFHLDSGIKSKYFPFYNEKLQGLRKGELSIITGATGSGKTTFLSQLSLDFSQQGAATLWGSFEIKNDILATNMLLQFSGEDLVENQQQYEYHAFRFATLPMYFMTFYGSQQIDQIIHTIQYAIYSYQVSHVVIDNLQFLIGTQGKGFQKFDLQDKTIEKFRKLASQYDVHISLVIHPKQVNESEDLNISSVFGSAKATQEADNVFILQNRQKYRVLEVKKNRFDGEIGRKGLIFDKSTQKFFELGLSDIQDLLMNKATVPGLVKLKQEQENKKKEKEKVPSPTSKSTQKTKPVEVVEDSQSLNEIEAAVKAIPPQNLNPPSKVGEEILGEKVALNYDADAQIHEAITEENLLKQNNNPKQSDSQELDQEFVYDMEEPLYKSEQSIKEVPSVKSFFEEGQQISAQQREQILKNQKPQPQSYRSNYQSTKVDDTQSKNSNSIDEQILANRMQNFKQTQNTKANKI